MSAQRPIFNRKLNLTGLIGDNGLNEYFLQKMEDADAPVHRIFARSEAQSVRLGRVYYELRGTVLVWNTVTWESRGTAREISPNIYGGDGEFATDRKGGESEAKSSRKQDLSERDSDLN
jgi:hypothetical protein